jgi:hypothetical protein
VQYSLLNRFVLLAWDLATLLEAPDDRDAINRFVISRDEFMTQVKEQLQKGGAPSMLLLGWAQ